MRAGLLAVALAAFPTPSMASPAQAGGLIPEGLWVLNGARSTAMLGKAPQTLWVVRDDGRSLTFVLVEHRAEAPIVATWAGAYDGMPRKVVGRDMTMTAAIVAPGELRLDGQTPQGSFSERCRVERRRTRLVCRGQLRAGNIATNYVDDYDWRASTGDRLTPSAGGAGRP